MKILIVDDKKENLMLLDTLLNTSGHKVEQAYNGKEALDKLKKESFQMIISDILMPVMDGYKLCQICKRDPKLRNIIFVFYSATYTSKEDKEYALQLGADDFLIKPMEPNEFLSAIHNITKNAEKQKISIKEPTITPEEAVEKHRDRLVNKLDKKVKELETEIKQKKKAEKALRNNEAKQSIAMKMAKLGYWEYDVLEDIFTFNDHFYAIFGTTAKEAGGYKMPSAQYAKKFLHPDDMHMVAEETKKAIQSTDPDYSRQIEHRIIYENGDIGYIAVRFSIIKDEQGRTIKTYGANQDITKHKLAEEALRAANKRLMILHQITETLYESLELDVIFKHITDASVNSMGFTTAIVLKLEENEKNYRVRSLTSSRKLLTGIKEILGFPLEKLTIPASEVIKNLKRFTSGESLITKSLSEILYPMLSKPLCHSFDKMSDSKSYILAPLVLKEKLIGGILVSSPLEKIDKADMEMLNTFASTAVQAISNADMHDRTNKAKEQVQKNLKEKEILLRELYHRTKNNMQVIASLLRIHASTIHDEQMKKVCYDIESKILSMALVHQKLYESKNLSYLNLKEYFENLISLLRTSFTTPSDQFNFLVESDDIKVLIDIAIPCGLIINELVSNSLKHAFPKNKKGEIKVKLYLTPKNELIIEVSDNGVGLPAGFDLEKDAQAGLKSVIVLVEHQLQGKIKITSHKGVQCRIVLKEQLYKPRV